MRSVAFAAAIFKMLTVTIMYSATVLAQRLLYLTVRQQRRKTTKARHAIYDPLNSHWSAVAVKSFS